MLNKVVLIGRLTRDPELRYTPSGVPVASFGLAVERPYSNQQGQREVDFIDIVTWRKLAELCANHIGKGRLVAVDGRLQVSAFEGQDGQKRRKTEVVADTVKFLDWPKDGSPKQGNDQQGGSSYGREVDIPEDDLPF
ncbi:single-strand DNA-binding protein [Desulfitispora alkaliphila]|uniref:single-stranded DNA-binding protein n=1 Tax=Desulfitispora alkaliphila TaxID=622674 RepID=UPI003D1DB7F2